MNSSRRQFLMAGAAGAAMFAQSRPKLKVGIIGTGHRAWILIAVMKNIPDIEIVALADPTPQFLDRAATSVGYPVRTYPDYRKMLAEEKEIEAVINATPGALHAETTIAAFERGLHVMCEKPMATTVEDANRMIAAGKKAGKLLQIDHQMRLDPVYSRLHDLVAEGRAGEVKFVSGYLYRGDWNPASWKTPDRHGQPRIWRVQKHWTGSSLIEDGIHEIDVLHWTVKSRVARIFASGGNSVYKDRETIDHAALIVEYENGVKLQFGYSLFGLDRDEEMEIIGSEGILKTAKGSLILQRRGAPAGTIPIEDFTRRTGGNPAGAPENPANQRQIQLFVDNVRNNRQPATGGEAGKEAIKIGLLAQKSIDERRIVDWKDLPA